MKKKIERDFLKFVKFSNYLYTKDFIPQEILEF